MDTECTEVVNGVEKPLCFFQSLWENYQDEIIIFGKDLLLAVLVLLLSFLVCRIGKKMIFKAADRIGKFGKIDQSVSKIFYSVFRVFVWLITLLIILDLFGVNTASVLTVLGAAGLAVGLAMKDSLSNIAAGLMLLILRPYKSGDYVDCGSVSGTIREMGIFSTELITIDGMYILVPNSVIFGSPVKNYSRNPLRRADIVLGIAYSDPLPQAIEVMKKLMDEHPEILDDPAPEVLVAELADNSVNLTLRFWVKNERFWDVYWDVKASLKPAVEAAGLNIPFPQRVITLATPLPEISGK